MRITTYQTRLNEERIVTLVKEKSGNYPDIEYIDSPESCVRMIETVFDASNLTEERLWLIALNGGRKVSGVFEVSHGTLTASLVHPREIYSRAILAAAASIIIAHNHPSGCLTISEQDREVTRSIKQAGELLGIKLDDHLVLADGDYVSAM